MGVDSNPFVLTYISDSAHVAMKECPEIQATIESGFALKRVLDMIRTYSQMYRTDKYSE